MNYQLPLIRWNRLTGEWKQYDQSDFSVNFELGQQWSLVFQVNIPMNDCIDVGLITMNETPSSPATAWFDQVSISGTGSQPLQGIDTHTMNNTDLGKAVLDVGLYPNPAKETVNLELEQLLGQKVTIEVFNHLGQSVFQRVFLEVTNSVEQLNLNTLTSGTYFVKVSTADWSVTKKMILLE